MSQILTPLTLYTCAYDIQEYAWWNDSDGVADPWVGQAYKWQITASVNGQPTGNFDNGFAYTEADIRVGDWIAIGTSAPVLAVRITEIISAAGSTLIAIAEDVDRYNLHMHGAGMNPASTPGFYDCLIFRVGSDGLPVTVNLTPQGLLDGLYTEMFSRFEFRNYLQSNYEVNQPGQRFVVGKSL